MPTDLTSVLCADGSVVAPEGPMDMGDALGELLRAYCRKQDIPWKEEGNPPRRYRLTSRLHPSFKMSLPQGKSSFGNCRRS